MRIDNTRGRLLASTIIAGTVAAMAAAGSAAAQTAAPATATPPAATAPQEIIVTGSLIRRLNTETPSPIQVITSTDLKNSGYTSLAEVLTNITANGAGMLSANNSEAFAGGASGIALRGLSVGDTLTLVDGHRIAPYPLSDDGERPFTDIQSLPFFAVDHVEVLKDGASSIYGSDALAGVVNVILKKQITGFEGLAESGTTQHGGGATNHFALAFGKGDLATDGFNAFVTAEYREQAAITLGDRQYTPWGNLDYTGIGGNNLTPGAVNIFNGGQPATLTPYLVNPDNSLTFLGSGCNAAALAASKCTYTSPQKLESPTHVLSVLAGLTKDFDGWEAKLRLSFFDSRGQQSGSGYDTYPGASFGGNVSNPIGGTPIAGIGAVASFGLPANYLGSGSPAGAYLEGVIPQLGLSTINIDSKTYRAALDVTGTVWGWDVTGSAGYSYIKTTMSFDNYINYDTLYTDLTTFNSAGQPLFNPLGGNSSSVLAAIAPEFNNTATDYLVYGEADATRKLFNLPGGDLSVAAGVSVTHKYLHNPGPADVLDGEIGGTFSTYAIGGQTDAAEYLEVDANLFHSLEINAGLRDDYYNTYGNSIVPKVGVKWQALKTLALRGTFSQGFRAPSAAENGLSGTAFGLGGFQDPILCGDGIGQVPAACSEGIGFVQKTNPLRPETSTNFTGGAVFEPIHNLSATIDYYHIVIDHQIISASELPTYSFGPSNCVRGPDLPINGVVVGYQPDGTPILGTATPLAGPVDACNSGYVNAQSTETSGIDAEAQYKFNFGGGTVRTTIEYTHLLDYNLTAPDGTIYKLAGTHGPSGVSGDTGNPRNRVDGSVTYDHGPVSATVSGYWIGPYSVTDPSASGGAQATCAGAWNGASALAFTQPSAINAQYCEVKGFTDVNFTTTYKITSKLTARFVIDNVLDASAPIDAETYGGSFTPFNPAMHEDGVIGRFFQLGFDYKY